MLHALPWLKITCVTDVFGLPLILLLTLILCLIPIPILIHVQILFSILIVQARRGGVVA